MFYKKIENDKIKALYEMPFPVLDESYEEITEEEYQKLAKEIAENTIIEPLPPSDNPTYAELSEACDILMGGVE